VSILYIKIVTDSIVFVNVKLFQHSLIIVGKARGQPLEWDTIRPIRKYKTRLKRLVEEEKTLIDQNMNIHEKF
jgi:hypothetical protein